MRGLKVQDLVAVMDFIYNGEARVCQEDLEAFLALAENLQLKGLAQSRDDTLSAAEDPLKETPNQHNVKTLPVIKQEKYLHQEIKVSTRVENNTMVENDGNKLFVPADTTLEDVRNKIDSLMENVNERDQIWKCTVCGKETKGRNARTNLRGHIETHMEGLSYNCNQCGKNSRSSNALNIHVSRFHKK